MSAARPSRETPAADVPAVDPGSSGPLPRRSRSVVWAAIIGALALIGLVSHASALILSGGPVDTLPGGGTCTLSGVPSSSTGGTVSCNVNLGAHTKVYFGIRNDVQVSGNTMTGSAATAASAAVFRFASNTSSTITYTSATTIPDLNHGTQPVTSRLVLTLTSGSGFVVPAGGNPANNGNGDVQAAFQLTSASFTIRVDVKASNIFFGLGQACPAVYDPTATPPSGAADVGDVNLGLYYSDCGDGQLDSPEQCDLAAANGSPTSCCTAACQFRSATEVCRPGAGPPCDNSETCSGASAICPMDDAPINLGMVCRSGSGDACDQNELCTGVPGQPCPPDDAPTKVGFVCRVASVGDVCDENETCTGAPGAPCPPDDAPGKLNLVCRAGSGDVCDPPERCSGIPGQGCPADVVANPTTLCRAGSGDACDPDEHCTAIPGQTCPANVVRPAGTTCRAAAGTCDVAETCSGAAGQQCPPDAFVAAHTPCDADASVCTVDECDGNNHCVFNSNLNCEDGNVCTQDSCDPHLGCVRTGQPSSNCVGATRALLKIRNSSDDVKDRLTFTWKGGPAPVTDMGNPNSTTRYELCIYDTSGVRMALGVPGGANWSAIGPPNNLKGFTYRDPIALNAGVSMIKTSGSNQTKAKVKVLGKGTALPDTTSAFSYPVTAQLYAVGGMCWNAQFDQSQTRKNDGNGYFGFEP
jgi:hypothetical protein